MPRNFRFLRFFIATPTRSVVAFSIERSGNPGLLFVQEWNTASVGWRVSLSTGNTSYVQKAPTSSLLISFVQGHGRPQRPTFIFRALLVHAKIRSVPVACRHRSSASDQHRANSSAANAATSFVELRLTTHGVGIPEHLSRPPPGESSVMANRGKHAWRLASAEAGVV